MRSPTSSRPSSGLVPRLPWRCCQGDHREGALAGIWQADASGNHAPPAMWSDTQTQPLIPGWPGPGRYCGGDLKDDPKERGTARAGGVREE